MTSIERFGLQQRVAVRLRWKKTGRDEGYEELAIILIGRVVNRLDSEMKTYTHLI